MYPPYIMRFSQLENIRGTKVTYDSLKKSYMWYEVCDIDSHITWPYQIADHHCRITWVLIKDYILLITNPPVNDPAAAVPDTHLKKT